MKSKTYCILVSIIFFFKTSFAQKDFNDYVQFYPLGESPNICFKSSLVKTETILFEANPIVRYNFSNNILKGLLNDKDHVRAWYVAVRSHLRMYTDNSLPVKTPSYRVLLGTQHIFRLPKDDLLAVSVESGHYSNGQAGCAFSENFEDGAMECDSIYDLITPETNLSDILNRKSGNFSTNLTEIIFNYRKNHLDDDDIPDKIHSFKLGILIYHDRFLQIFDFGGFSDDDIKIYGRFRFLLGYEYTRVNKKGLRFSIAENIELIQGAHKHVNPVRAETIFSFFPFQKMKEFGFFAGYIYGHDNYNFRFVDSGHQAAVGLTWSLFPPFTIKKLRAL